MAATTSSPNHFTFGVEIELLVNPKAALGPSLKTYNFNPAVRPRSVKEWTALQKDAAAHSKAKAPDAQNRDAVRRALADALNKAGVEATATETSEYSVWTVKKEGSLDEVPTKDGGYWAIELVSPVLHTRPGGNPNNPKDDGMDWYRDITKIFKTLGDSCDIQLTRGCSMHVHVAPDVEGQWKPDTLRGLMKGIAVFDDAITKIMPADRKVNPWCRSNFHDIPGSTRPDDKATPMIKTPYDAVTTKGWKPLFDVFDKGVKINRTTAVNVMGQNRTVSMNFAPLAASCGTVEFRRPPGVKTAADAHKWTAFTLAFVSACLEPNWHTAWAATNKHATVAHLQQFVQRGVARLGWKAGVLDVPRAIVEDKSPATPPSAFDLELIKRKIAKANSESEFVKKIVRSRQNTPVSSANNSPAGSPALRPKKK